MASSSSSFVEAMHTVGGGMDVTRPSRDDSDSSQDPTDPFSFLDSTDFLSGFPNTFTGETSKEYSSDVWSTGNPSIGDGMSAQPDLCGTSFDNVDFSSMLSMGNLLNYDPTLFSNGMLEAMGATAPSSVDTSLPSLPVDVYNLCNAIYPTGLGFNTSSLVTHRPVTDDAQEMPMLETSQVPVPTSAESPMSQEIERLTARARQIAGLADADAATPSNKLPIPRLQPTASASTSRLVPASLRSDASPSPSSISQSSRTKLSHSAVERRYRTNMKQHLKNLRDVVPALRVLELKPGNRISNLSLKPGTRRTGAEIDVDAEGDDVIDERGYIDGVKVARNGSKTTAVLKTIEYIRVLKRRELRLKREQEGLKKLVCSFPGGPELLQRWETMWHEKFGGPEKDEIGEESLDVRRDDHGDEAAGTMDNGEDYTSMSGRESTKRAKVDDLDKGKETKNQSRTGGVQPKKYVPIMPAKSSLDSCNVPLVPVPLQPSKRKRGRPRNFPSPPIILTNGLVQGALNVEPRHQPTAIASGAKDETGDQVPMNPQSGSDVQEQHQETQSGQFLLAVFAFFSFLTSPVPFSSSFLDRNRDYSLVHNHSGFVMTSPDLDGHFSGNSNFSAVVDTLSWRDALQLSHLVFSAFLVFSIMRPRLARIGHLSSKYLYSNLCRLNTVAASLRSTSAHESLSVKEPHDPVRIFRAGAAKLRKLSNGGVVAPAAEAKISREALGLRAGFTGLLLMSMRLISLPERHDYWRLERRTYMRLVELVALDANASIITRLQMYICVFRFKYGCSATAIEMASFALVLHPIWRAKSIALWERALAGVHGRGPSSLYIYHPYDTFVLESMSVDEAALNVLKLGPNAGARSFIAEDGICRGENSRHRELASPLAALARQAVHDHIRARAERVFLEVVSGEERDCASSADDKILDEDRIIAAGRSLDPPTASLVELFDRVCNSEQTQHDVVIDRNIDREDVDEWGDFSVAHAELRALVDGIALCRQLYASLPGLSSGRELTASGNDALRMHLKQCLESAAFERTDALKEARDNVVDRISAI